MMNKRREEAWGKPAAEIHTITSLALIGQPIQVSIDRQGHNHQGHSHRNRNVASHSP